MNIKGYSNYYYKDGKVFSKSTDKESKPHQRGCGDWKFKLKNYEGCWKSLSFEKTKSLAGDVLKLPKGTVKAEYCEHTYVSPDGEFFTMSPMYPSGRKLTISKNRGGYSTVSVKYKGRNSIIECHKIMCQTFIDKDYTSKGLVCLHKDDDKTNCRLSNLKVGTYSENNKSAYNNGLNKSNSEALKKSPMKGNRVDWPDDTVLEKMYASKPLTVIGRHFNCSDNAVKRRLKKVGIIK